MPTGDLSRCSKLLDHIVGSLLELHWHVEAERLGGLHVDHQLELDRRLDRKLAWLGALEDAVGIDRCAAEIIGEVSCRRSAGHQAQRRNGLRRWPESDSEPQAM